MWVGFLLPKILKAISMDLDNQYGRMRFSSGDYRRYVRLSSRVADNKPNEENSLVHGSYSGLLWNSRWRAKRAAIIKRDGEKCVVCHSPANLQVHHRQYHYIKELGKFKPPWDYDDYLLVTLCENCNKRGHAQYKVPIINL